MRKFSEQLLQCAQRVETRLREEGVFDRIERTAFANQAKVLDAFAEYRVSDSHFGATTGYGYDDRGREVLDLVYAKVMDAECALVRHQIISGTHALAIGLYGLLRPGDTLLAVTGKPYDTLEEVIGIRGNGRDGSLKEFGVGYRQLEFRDGKVDSEALSDILANDKSVKVVFVQRSKGYSVRPTLSGQQIGDIAKIVHHLSGAYCVVDNCYGEFCEEHEPTYYGADLVIGSLIKNPGGGMAETGGYLAGKREVVELCSYRLTCPGIGMECGATLGQNKNMFKGLFYAPHTVAQALKTALFAGALFEDFGFVAYPPAEEQRYDIIQTIQLKTQENLLAFCEGIQAGSPVDSHVVPTPWEMPGYAVPVVMAAGTFTQGASIELSADAPCVPPYTVYLQGGLTYESGKLGILSAAAALEEKGRLVLAVGQK